MKYLIYLLLITTTLLSDRCIQYKQEVRRFHFYYFGLTFPYLYSYNQLKAESNCRDVISKDYANSRGLTQITWKLWKAKLIKEGIPNLSKKSYQLRGQAYINYYYYKRLYCAKLFMMYQAYNGGLLINKDLVKARSCNYKDMLKVCKRKDIKFKNGTKINACKINYNYSKFIYKKSGNKELSELWEFY